MQEKQTSGLNGKTIVVLGAAGLIGSQIVKDLLAEGCEVVAADISKNLIKNKLIDLKPEHSPRSLQIEVMDVFAENSVYELLHQKETVSGLVNAIYPKNKNYGKSFIDNDFKTFSENLELQLGSLFLVLQQSARYFLDKQLPFALVNIASIYGVVSPRFEIYKNTKMTTPIEYAISKSATIHLNKYVSRFINDSRFRVNSISPGGIFDFQDENFLSAYKEQTLGCGMLNEADVTGAVLFLLSDQSTFITGQNLIIDDGFTL